MNYFVHNLHYAQRADPLFIYNPAECLNCLKRKTGVSGLPVELEQEVINTDWYPALVCKENSNCYHGSREYDYIRGA